MLKIKQNPKEYTILLNNCSLYSRTTHILELNTIIFCAGNKIIDYI
jgi:hypothetical protein